MAEEKITPEEKLLKIIENPAAQQQKTAAAAPKSGGAASSPKPKSLAQISAISKSIFKHVTLPIVNRALVVVCVVATAFFIYNYSAFSGNLESKFEKISTDITPYKPSDKNIAIAEEDLGALLDRYKQRNMFSFIHAAPSGQPGAPPDVAGMLASLKLVGVIWSDNPQAMVEDTTSQRTLLVGAGDKIGGLQVKKILRDKIVVGKDAQEWELR